MNKELTMKVLFVKQFLDRSEIDLALALHQRGVFIRVLSHSDSLGQEALAAAGIHIASAPYKSKIALGLIRQIRRLLTEEGFDIIYSSDGKGLANAIWASYFMPVKIVGYRGTLAKIRRTDPGYWLGILNPRVEHVICVNRSIYDYMHKFYPAEKLSLNYKGYSLEWAEEAINKPVDPVSFPAGAFVVCLIANTRNRPSKGLPVLIRAMELLESTNVHLMFIGEHDERDRLLAAQGTASDRIHFLGVRKNAAGYLRYAHAFVLSSIRDGLPRAMKEAMAQSLPIITTNIEGPTELVTDEESGLWVEPNNPEALAQAIKRLSESPELCKKLGDAGRQRLVEQFSSEAFVDNTYKVYQQVLASAD
jgi:glycosyltransferase involved in cell wall biosynthesis